MKVYFQIALLFLVLIFTACNTPGISPYHSNKTESRLTVALLPYNGFDTALLNDVLKEVESFYQCSIIILPATNLPSNAFYVHRQRYRADSLLVFQKQLANDSIRSVVGFTQKDISTTNKLVADWGVFGLGYCP